LCPAPIMVLVELSLIWKLGLTVVLLGAIFLSAVARAPRRSFPSDDLRAMVISAVGLYAVGLGASLSHHEAVATLVYAFGIGVSALAVWLSRGADRREPPPRDDDPESPPPDAPVDPPELDWDAFERQLGVYSDRRQREPVLTR